VSETLRITQHRSVIGAKQQHRETLRSLGLRKIGQTVEHRATPQVKGMVHSVRHLVKVEEA
jgi:large subunit ribosomal protein L30